SAPRWGCRCSGWAAFAPRPTRANTSRRAPRWWRSAPPRSPTRGCRNGSRASSPVAELVVALDLPSGRDALALADRLPGLRWAKVGPVLFTREGPALVRELGARGIRVFLDLKWHDIPSVVAAAVAAAPAEGGLAVVGVTVLTSHQAAEFAQVVGRGVPDLGAEAERLARLAVAAGLAGVVASGRELGLLRAA